MKKITNFVKLDLYSIKEYITTKRLITFLGVSIFIGIANKSPFMSIAMILFFIMSFATYPFAAADQNNLDILYPILGFNREDVVKGRYTTIIGIYLVGIIIETLLYIFISLVLKTPINFMELLFLNSTMRLVVILGQSIQIPSFFKEGYLKSKVSTFLPYVIIFVVFTIGYLLVDKGIIFNIDTVNNFITTNINLITLVFSILALVVLFISYLLSKKHYYKREF